MYLVVLIAGFVFQLFNKRLLFWVFSSFLILMAIFRYGTGLDYFTYEFLYNRLQYSIINEVKYGIDQQEVGFRVIGSLLKNLGFSYQQYLILFSVVTLFFVIKTCKRYSTNPTLSLLIFFCFYYLTWTFSGIRQGVVIAIGLYFLLRSIEKNSIKSFSVIVLLLTLIHSSALILFVLYFISKIDFKKKTLIVISIASVIFSVLPIGALISKMTWMPFYYRVAPYLNPDTSLNLPDFQGFGRIVFLVIAFYCYDQYSKQSDFSKKVINMYIVSLAMYFILQFSELTAARLSIYGKFLDIIILANLLYLYRKPINKLVYVYGIFALCFMYLFKEGTELERGYVEKGGDSFFPSYVNIYNKENFYFESEYFDLSNN
jgi:EpsG family